MMRVIVERGDITKSRVEAIVTAANPYLRGGGGVDGAVHRAAGPELLLACQDVPVVGAGPGVPIRCPVGEARITAGFHLSRWVIHAVGPVYRNYNMTEAIRLLAMAHVRSLQLAVANNVRSIAFPAISCGLYGYPVEEAVQVVSGVMDRWQSKERGGPDEVQFVLFDDICYEAYERGLGGGGLGVP